MRKMLQLAGLVLVVLVGVALGSFSVIPSSFAVDGSPNEWDDSVKLHPPWWKTDDYGSNNVALYGAKKGGDYFFYVRPENGKKLLSTVLWINADANVLTGEPWNPLYFIPNGTDLYVVIDVVNEAIQPPRIYTGCSPQREIDSGGGCSTLHATMSTSDYKVVSTASNSFEMKISKTNMETYTGLSNLGDIGFSIRMKHSPVSQGDDVDIYLPRFYQNPYMIYDGMDNLNDCVVQERRAGLVFSDDQQDFYPNNRSYAQFYMVMQYQMFQAGTPHDRISLSDMMDTTISCQYSVIVFPYLAYVSQADWEKFRKAILILRHVYGVHFLTSGDFATNDPGQSTGPAVAGDPYLLMEQAIGIGDNNPVFGQFDDTYLVVQDTTTSTLFSEYSIGEEILDTTYVGIFTNMYIPAPFTIYTTHVLATYRCVLGGVESTFNSVFLTELDPNLNPFGRPKSGKFIHFSTDILFGNSDLGWRAIQDLMLDGEPVGFGLRMGRMKGLFAMRNDMDQSMFKQQAVVLEPLLLNDFLKPWYYLYNVVGTYFLNIGNNAPEETTDWNIMKPLYEQYIAIENEIGSHSYTHPHDINLLTPAELEFQFDDAQNVIMTEMGLSRLGTAQPGAPDVLSTAYGVEPFFQTTYFSGGYSGLGAGFPGAFGYLDDTSTMVYMAPQMFFDFTMMQFLNWTIPRAEAFWQEQWENHTKRSSLPIIHWPIHDYGPTDWESLKGANQLGIYNGPMFTNFLERAYNDGIEFVTCMQLHDRIRAFSAASLTTTKLATNQFRVVVPTQNSHSYGTFALSIQQSFTSGYKIHTVGGGHKAYSDTQMFLLKDGGTFDITVGTGNPPAEETHISNIDMRMDLQSVNGDGTDLSFSVFGRGIVEVTLVTQWANENLYEFNGATSTTIQGNKAMMNFSTVELHTATVTRLPTQAPTLNPTLAPSKSPTSSPTNAPSLSPTSSPTTPIPTKNPTNAPSISPTSAPTNAPTPTPEPESNLGLIIGAVGGGCAAIAILAVAMFAITRRKATLAVGSPQKVEDML